MKRRKNRARTTAAKARRIAYEMDPDAGRRLAANFPDKAWPPLHSVVAGYRAIRDEIDPAPLMETFLCEQARLCLPCVVAPDQPLVFRAWSPGDPLVRGVFGTEEPAPEAPEARPSLVLVPLLGFDETGRRIGYGAGFYDRTLEALRSQAPVTAIGIAYEAQRLDRVPADRHDEPLDWVVTEQRARRTAT